MFTLLKKIPLLFLLFFCTTSFAIDTRHVNGLINEDSPYLQQHAHNPVNWMPWTDETLKKARQEHKPIFLSIGYSTCHWCHVMAHESFENVAIAELINRDFIAIKVDREELPHLDKYYQNIHILLKKRSGGWPLTAILTEQAKVFFIGTYIPENNKYNIEGLNTLLPSIAQSYKQNRTKIYKQAKDIEAKMNKAERIELSPVKIELSITKDIFEGLMKQYDPFYYGFSIAPKFPESSKVGLLFDLDALGVKDAREKAFEVLDAMALHGLYDQVEGGFFRYSTDAAWEIPHFEKMLYTNAELIGLYSKAYSLTQDTLYKEVVVETIDMIERRFEKEGLYFSASDADSGHEEGGYFIYSYDEIMQTLQGLEKQEQKELIESLDITKYGNFEGKMHIQFYAEKYPLSYKKIRPILKNMRSLRQYPFIDKKINTAWNAMMIEALFKASLLDEKYQSLGVERMQALLNKMYQKGVLYHQSLVSKTPVQKALLEDYAFLVSALIEAYDKTYDEQYIYLAKKLSDEAIKKFYDGKFWLLNEEGLKVHAGMLDKYYTSPMNKMLLALLKLSSLTGEQKYLALVKKSLRSKSSLLKKEPARYPSAMRVFLRKSRGYITLKSTKNKLLSNQNQINKIKYPFVVTKASSKLKGYLSCDMRQCFAIENNLDKIIKTIESR